MGTYIIRRIVVTAAMLVAVSVVTFLLFAMLPSDAAALTCGKACTPEIVESNRQALGLDRPVYVQYATFVWGLFAGRDFGSGTAAFHCSAPCLGYSFPRGEEVTTLLVERLPVTVSLAVGGFVLWMALGLGGGVLAALKAGRWQDRAVTTLAVAGYSMPAFFVGLLLVFFVQIKWGLIGFEGYAHLWDDPARWFRSLILPWITVALLYAAFYTRLTRTQLLETLREDYVRTARAKGLRERTVVRRHALPAALPPVVTAAGLDLAGLLGGAVITEQVFNLNGIGKLAIDSVLSADLPVVTAVVLVAAAFVLVANLLVDLLYAVLDPRVRLQ